MFRFVIRKVSFPSERCSFGVDVFRDRLRSVHRLMTLVLLLTFPELCYSQNKIRLTDESPLFKVVLDSGQEIICLDGETPRPGKLRSNNAIFVDFGFITKKQIRKLRSKSSSLPPKKKKRVRSKIKGKKALLKAAIEGCESGSKKTPPGHPHPKVQILSDIPDLTNQSELAIVYSVFPFNENVTEIFQLLEGQNEVVLNVSLPATKRQKARKTSKRIIKKAALLRFAYDVELDTIPPLIELKTTLPEVVVDSSLILEYTVDGILHTESRTLLPGENQVILSATDLAGNYAERIYSVFREGSSQTLVERFDEDLSKNFVLSESRNLERNGIHLGLKEDPKLPYPEGIVGHWSFDAWSGNVIKDMSGLGHDADLVSPSKLKISPSALRGKAFDFYPSGDPKIPGASLRLRPPLPLQTEPSGLTVTFWMNPKDEKSEIPYEYLIDNYLTSTSAGRPGGFKIMDVNGELQFIADNTDGELVTVPLGIETRFSMANTWSYVTVTYEDSVIRSFLNGILKNEERIKTPLSLATKNWLTIGERSTTSYFGYYGALDEVMIFSRGLQQEEVLALMTRGQVTSKDLTFAEPATQILPRWRGVGPALQVEISTDQGSTWCPVESERVHFDGRCSLPAQHFQYRVRFPSKHSKIEWISFDWKYEKLPECADGFDNDGDGLIDSRDIGCSSSADTSEDAGACEKALPVYPNGAWHFVETKGVALEPWVQLLSHGFFKAYEESKHPLEYDYFKHDQDLKKIVERFGSKSDKMFILDWEIWEAHWNEAPIGPQVYAQYAVKDIVKKEHPGWNDAKVTAEAKLRYNAKAKEIWLGTIRYLHKHMPNARFSWYGYPLRLIGWLKGEEESNRLRAANDELNWLWQELDFLAPSFYRFWVSKEGTPNWDSTIPAERNAFLLEAWMKEAKRLRRNAFQPIFAFLWFLYHPNSGNKYGYHLLNEIDRAQMFDIPERHGVDGFIFWNGTYKTVPLSDQNDFFHMAIVPEMEKVKKRRCQ